VTSGKDLCFAENAGGVGATTPCKRLAESFPKTRWADISPYLTEPINRFGNYSLDLRRSLNPLALQIAECNRFVTRDATNTEVVSILVEKPARKSPEEADFKRAL